jgi:hypothetical protein
MIGSSLYWFAYPFAGFAEVVLLLGDEQVARRRQAVSPTSTTIASEKPVPRCSTPLTL